MPHRVKDCLCLTVCLLLITFAVYSEEPSRFALVIGCGNYKTFGTLKNPLNDAADLSSGLGDLGFTVTKLVNPDRKQINAAVNELYSNLRANPGSTGFFWYSGHGVQSKGENYLIPSSAVIENEFELEDEGIPVSKVLAALNDAGNAFNIIVLDACRNNPLPATTRSASRGLSVVGKAPPESIVVYSTGTGEVAQDGEGRNSPFAQAFLKNLANPGDITMTLKSISADTKELTKGLQVPYIYSSLTQSLYLSSAGSTAPESLIIPTAAKPLEKTQPGKYFFNALVSMDLEGYKSHYTDYPEPYVAVNSLVGGGLSFGLLAESLGYYGSVELRIGVADTSELYISELTSTANTAYSSFTPIQDLGDVSTFGMRLVGGFTYRIIPILWLYGGCGLGLVNSQAYYEETYLYSEDFAHYCSYDNGLKPAFAYEAGLLFSLWIFDVSLGYQSQLGGMPGVAASFGLNL